VRDKFMVTEHASNIPRPSRIPGAGSDNKRAKPDGPLERIEPETAAGVPIAGRGGVSFPGPCRAILSAMKPSIQEQEGSPPTPLRTGEPVDPTDLHVGDEVIFASPAGRFVLARVTHIKRARGELFAFVPHTGTKPLSIERIVKAWRSPESKRTAAEPGR
jgi:hypothetical protein